MSMRDVSPKRLNDATPDEWDQVNKPDMVEKPRHYMGEVECIDAIKSAIGREHFISHCQACVMKYVWRWKAKGGVEDLRKARVYLEWMIGEEVNGS